MPRRRSSGNRSASIPVSARRSAVLPWSMWPAVPTTTVIAGLIRSLPDQAGDGTQDVGVSGRLHGPQVEDDGAVGDPGDDARIAAAKISEESAGRAGADQQAERCLLYTSPSPR